MDQQPTSLIGSLLFAALLGTARAEASLPKAADVDGLQRPALELSVASFTEPPRFGFAEELDLLNVEKEVPRFSLFGGVETRRFEITYARNNPLKYVDPDGRFTVSSFAFASALANGNQAAVHLAQWAPAYIAGMAAAVSGFSGLFGLGAAAIGPLSGAAAFVAATDAVHSPIAVAVVADIIEGAVPGKETRWTRQFTKNGENGFARANKEFDSLGPKDVQDRGNGLRTGTLENGDKVVVRPDSSPKGQGPPTLEIQPTVREDKVIKIRYPEE